MTRKQAIREKCIDCCCGSKHEVKLCTATKCPLWVFRLGTEVKYPQDGQESPQNPTDSDEIN